MHELFARALRGERTERPPVWLMRQAGRYLPRYRELRADRSFREAVTDPAIAEEISLLPYDRFGVDAVVMFADILEILAPLGIEYRVESGVGPVIEDTVKTREDVPTSVAPMADSLEHVGDLLGRLRASLGDDATTIGFAGGPFTVGSYLVAGEPTRSHRPIRRLRVADPETWTALLDAITEATVEYLRYQEAAGAEVIQLFETYAGHLSPAAYRDSLLDRHREILDAVDVPTIVFARGMGGHLEDLAATSATAVSLDWTVELPAAREALGPAVPVQGNLDPAELLGSRQRVVDMTEALIDAGSRRGHILNLGHGVLAETPPENVAAFVETANGATD